MTHRKKKNVNDQTVNQSLRLLDELIEKGHFLLLGWVLDEQGQPCVRMANAMSEEHLLPLTIGLIRARQQQPEAIDKLVDKLKFVSTALHPALREQPAQQVKEVRDEK